MATFFQSFSASIIMGYVSFESLRIFSAIFPLTKIWGIFMQGFCAAIVGVIVLVIVLKLLKNKQIDDVWRTLHQKIWKANVPPAEVEHL